MRISNINNYNALMLGARAAWCYSTDGVKVHAAHSLTEKLFYCVRALFYLNGNRKTLKSAILNSFTPIDRALIERKLADAKSYRKFKKENNEQAEALFAKPLEMVVSETMSGFTTDSIALTNQPTIELNTIEIRKLLNIHHIFKKIYSISEELDSNSEKIEVLQKNTIEKRLYDHFMDLFEEIAEGKGISEMPEVIEKFFANMPEDLADIFDNFESWMESDLSQLEFLSKYQNSKVMQKMINLIDGLNNFEKQLDQTIKNNKSEQLELEIFEKTFLDFIIECKKNIFNSAVENILVFESYKRHADMHAVYEDNTHREVVPYLRSMNKDDRRMFNEAWDQRIIDCRKACKKKI